MARSFHGKQQPQMLHMENGFTIEDVLTPRQGLFNNLQNNNNENFGVSGMRGVQHGNWKSGTMDFEDTTVKRGVPFKAEMDDGPKRFQNPPPASAKKEITDIALRQLRKVEMCLFHITPGMTCKKGTMCPFAHSRSELQSRPNLEKTAICPAVRAGKDCTSLYCKYAHSAVELRFSAQDAAAAEQQFAEAEFLQQQKAEYQFCPPVAPTQKAPVPKQPMADSLRAMSRGESPLVDSLRAMGRGESPLVDNFKSSLADSLRPMGRGESSMVDSLRPMGRGESPLVDNFKSPMVDNLRAMGRGESQDQSVPKGALTFSMPDMACMSGRELYHYYNILMVELRKAKIMIVNKSPERKQKIPGLPTKTTSSVSSISPKTKLSLDDHIVSTPTNSQVSTPPATFSDHVNSSFYSHGHVNGLQDSGMMSSSQQGFLSSNGFPTTGVNFFGKEHERRLEIVEACKKYGAHLGEISSKSMKIPRELKYDRVIPDCNSDIDSDDEKENNNPNKNWLLDEELELLGLPNLYNVGLEEQYGSEVIGGIENLEGIAPPKNLVFQIDTKSEETATPSNAMENNNENCEIDEKVTDVKVSSLNCSAVVSEKEKDKTAIAKANAKKSELISLLKSHVEKTKMKNISSSRSMIMTIPEVEVEEVEEHQEDEMKNRSSVLSENCISSDSLTITPPPGITITPPPPSIKCPPPPPPSSNTSTLKLPLPRPIDPIPDFLLKDKKRDDQEENIISHKKHTVPSHRSNSKLIPSTHSRNSNQSYNKYSSNLGHHNSLNNQYMNSYYEKGKGFESNGKNSYEKGWRGGKNSHLNVNDIHQFPALGKKGNGKKGFAK